jgi:hypothetical protein
VGYDVHITRKAIWHDELGPIISLDEWTELVRNDRELRLDGFAEAATREGQVNGIKDPSLSVWIAYSQSGRNGNQAWFWLVNGNIVAKNPDREILRKMYVIAQRLSAKVQGDEGEFYGPDGGVME